MDITPSAVLLCTTHAAPPGLRSLFDKPASPKEPLPLPARRSAYCVCVRNSYTSASTWELPDFLCELLLGVKSVPYFVGYWDKTVELTLLPISFLDLASGILGSN
ncbi:hypothetical protein Trydic_g12448 [Trypoxylus dichotomus]